MPIKTLFAFFMLLAGSAVKGDLLDNFQEGEKKKIEEKKPQASESVTPAAKDLRSGDDGKKAARPNKTPPQEDKKLPVEFEGEGLSGIRKAGTVELHKDVRVVQGDLTLQSENAKIFFDEVSNEVKQVVATGKVTMTKIDVETGKLIKASSEIAEFDAEKGIITLKGGAKLLKGEDLIVGNVIHYNLKTGWIKAEKVKGVVKP